MHTKPNSHIEGLFFIEVEYKNAHIFLVVNFIYTYVSTCNN